MKKIVREVAAVSRIVVLIGIVVVAAVAAGIAYVYWPRRALSPTAFFDTGNSVSAMISPEEGGTIETTGADGTNFTLEIPKDALLGPDNETISMKPITRLENTRFSEGFLAGVQLEPDGLQLYRTANLTIELMSPVAADEIVGFSCCGNQFHLVPLEVNEKALTFRLIHFSPYGAATGVKCDCAALAEPTSEATAKEKISCIFFNAGRDPEKLTESDMLEIIDAMLTWYASSVEPNLNKALRDDNLIQSAIMELFAWDILAYGHVQWLLGYMPDEIAAFIEDGWYLADLCVENAIIRNEQKCCSSDDRTQKIAYLNKLIWLEKIVDHLGGGFTRLSVGVECREVWCCGALLQPDSISISPAALTLYVGETKTLKATARNVIGDEIDDRHLSLTWENSNLAAVGLAGTSSVVSVTGNDEGQATIKVIAGNTFDPNKEVSATSQITVKTTPVDSVVIDPEEATISVDQTLTLNVTVYDKDGNQLTGYAIEWTIPPGGIVAFNPSTQKVTGVSPGTAVITATCQGKSASATITVVGGYRLTWKATVGYCYIYTCLGMPRDISERISEDRVFEGYAEIEEGSDNGNRTYQVTDFWANGHYEYHTEGWTLTHATGERDTWCDDYIADIADEGKDLIKQKIEDNFQVERHPNGSFKRIMNPAIYFFPRYEVGETMGSTDYHALRKEWKRTLCNETGTYKEYGPTLAAPWPWQAFVTRYKCYMKGIAEPKFIDYDKTTQTFHLEFESPPLYHRNPYCSEHLTIIYANSSRCDERFAINNVPRFVIIAYWEINVEVMHEEAGYSSLQSNNNSTASTNASIGGMSSTRNLDHTFITTMILIATTIHLAKRKPKIKPPTPNASLPQLDHESV